MSDKKSDRLLSLDVFRGITIAGMILVNNPGDWGNIYPPLKHAEWNGCTPTDYIFPFFLFIVGVAITFSLSKRKEEGTDQKKLIYQIIKRSLILFLLGLIMAGFPYFDLSTIRIPGVLQRIAVVYLISAILFLKTNIRTQGILFVTLLIVYWILMTFIPVPSIGYANLEPTTNLAAYFDNLLLNGHLWKVTKVWDPEGILSTLPAISTTLSGIFLGYWLKKKEIDDNEKTVWIFAAGIILLLLGIFWDPFFPINKSLWTSSYVLYTSGLALLFFAMCYWFIDIKKIKWWIKPFEVYGMNAITVFFLSGLLAKTMGIIKLSNTDGTEISLKGFLYQTYFTPYFSPINASLLWALIYVLFWLGIMWILYQKKIFIKV